MAQAPNNGGNKPTLPTTAPSKLDLIYAQLKLAPASKEEVVRKMVMQIAKRDGVVWEKLSAGQKSGRTRAFKEACSKAGISLDDLSE